MATDEELDELLEKLERRADRLQGASEAKAMRESDSFGRLPSALSSNAAGPRKGDAIGENYEVVYLLGRTETSSVLLVRHKGVDRLFAMKLLPSDLAKDQARVERFQEEARATSMIGHENIVFVTDFGKSNRFGLYFVMEYLDGETLAAKIAREGPQSIEATLNVAVCAGSALAAVHELGLVHCDVSPENLMSHRGDGEETWKLLDFGLSNKVVGGDEALGLYHEPLYVAPEQAMGAGVDATTDQFALAAVLYHMLVGRPPWPDRSWTTATPDQWTPPRQMPSAVRDDVAEFIDGVLLQALAALPEDRYRSVEALVANFQRASGQSRRPTIPPIDLPEAARAAQGYHASASVMIGTTFESEVSESSVAEDDEIDLVDPPSVEISLDMLPNMRPKITMRFQHAARLRREWRRNLVSGGLFVPTERSMARRTPVVAVIHFAPTGQEAAFPARIMEFTPPRGDAPGGLAVEIDPDLRDALHAFLFGLDLGLLNPTTVVRPLRSLDENAQLSANEAFFLTRLVEPMNVGRLRGMFASLPMDLDDIVAGLEEQGWVALEGEELPRGRTRSRPGNDNIKATLPGVPSMSPQSERNEFVRLTLQRADYFRNQGNFLAEIETLELAAQRSNEAVFHYRAALSRVQFQNDFDGATNAMRRACELEPDNPKYAKALYEMERVNPRKA